MAGFDLAAQAAAVTIEGRGRFNQDRAADGVARHVRGRRLDHAQALGRIGRNHIQRRRAAGIFRGADGDAVDADAVEVGIQATHHHETAFALVAGHADARQALQRLGHVLVRVLAQRVGRHGVFNGITAALEVNRAYLRFQLRTYFDAVQIGRRGAAAGRCSGFGCQHRRAGRHQQREADCQAQRVLLLHSYPQRCKDWVSTVCPRGCMGMTPVEPGLPDPARHHRAFRLK
ncbi:hypothetical protein D3C72_1238690 [compost metagenome]